MIKAEMLNAMDLEQGIQNLFDYIDTVFFFLKDLEGHILFSNKQLLEHYGFKSASQMLGKTDFDFLPRSLAEKYHWDDEQVIKQKTPLVKQVELFLDDSGVPDWYMTTKLPVLSRDGTAIGVMGVIQKYNSGHMRFMMDKRMSNTLKYLNAHYTEDIRISDLARASGVYPRKLQRLFKQKLNTSYRDMLTKLRILKACDLLRLSDKSISDIAIECGFYDQSSFTKHFKNSLGMTPRHYRTKY